MPNKNSPISRVQRPNMRPTRVPKRPVHHFLTLSVRPFWYTDAGPDQPPRKPFLYRPIDAGRISPNYVHSWAIDLRITDPTPEQPAPEDVIMLGFEPSDVILDWGENGDVITVLRADGHVLHKCTSEVDLLTAIRCSYTEVDRGRSPFRRLYVVLETSPRDVPRRFVLRSLVTFDPAPPTAEALRVEDDVNYDTTGPFVDAKDADGNEIYAPWWPGSPNVDAPGLPRSMRTEGWYLVGKNVADPRPGFFSLVFYNELEGRLRVYLLNRSLTADASGYRVEVSLVQAGRSTQLHGAFFPVAPNPADWYLAVATVPRWGRAKWIMLEMPMLYPMGRDLPIDPGTSPEASGPEYRSLYEDRFLADQRNVVLQVQVVPYVALQVAGNIIGQAIGEAIQDFGTEKTVDVAAAAAKAMWEGLSWYKGASDFADAVGKKLKADEPSWGDKKQEVLAFLQAGASAVAGPLAAAGAMISLISSFVAEPEPLRLSIDLAVQAKLWGTISGTLQNGKTRFYLPGRFSVEEALRSEGLPPDATIVDSQLPRYDRPLGLFGYRFNPARATIRILKTMWLSRANPDELLSRRRFGVPYQEGNIVAEAYDLQQPTTFSYRIHSLPPVIYNTSAEIYLIPSNGEWADDGTRSRVTYKLLFDTPPGNSRGSIDPERGMELVVNRPLLPLPYRSSLFSWSDVPVHSLVWIYTPGSYTPWYGVWTPVYDCVHSFWSLRFVRVGTTEYNKEYEGEESDDGIIPIHDVMFRWDIRFNAYNRETAPNGFDMQRKMVRLIAPISVELVIRRYRLGAYWEEFPGYYVRSTTQSSRLTRVASTPW